MENFSVKELFDDALDFLAENKSPICFGLGIAGMFGTIGLCFRYVPKIKEDIANAKFKKALGTIEGEISDEQLNEIKLTPVETVEAVWKDALPIAGGTVFSTIALAESFKTDRNDILGLTAGYTLLEKRYKDLDRKFLEKAGEKKFREAKEEIAAEKAKEVHVENAKIFGKHKEDSVLFKDGATGRLFWSDMNTVKTIVNQINYRLIHGEDWIPANDWFYEIGLSSLHTYEELGWRIEKGLFEPSFGPGLTDDGTNTCMVVDYELLPYAANY